MHTAELNFSNFVIEYIGKIETEFENTCSSGAQMGSNHKKMEVENLVTHSLKRVSVTRFFVEYFPKIQKWLTLCGVDNYIFKKSKSDLHCAELDSAHTNTAWSQTPRSASLRGVLPGKMLSS